MAEKWLDLAKEAYEASSAYVDSNYRNDWDYSIKSFRNEHGPGSKYLSDEYKGRTKIFPPHTRTIIRKNEAAAAVALFSNMDIVDMTPGDPDDPMSVASAAALKEVLEYRLSRSIPAFPLVMGAVQDAQTTGTVCSYNYWEYLKKDGRIVKDKPCIELRPIENIRIDGGANWLDPVGTTPYFCDIIPMYVCDVKAMMNNKDDKTKDPKWFKYEDSDILQALPDIIDSTHRAREGNKLVQEDKPTSIKAFDIVWVMRWLMRDSQSNDHVFYTLGTHKLLSDAQPIEEVYFHGKRPYTLGYAILETHRALKSGLPILVKPLQQESTEITNQRIDNVKFVLNKRWLVARGRQVDVQSLVRNVPGGVTLLTDPKNDIVESNWADVTSSSYVEHDRIKTALDELAGNFSPSTKVANNAVNDTLGGSKMALQGAGLMTDYLLRTIIETWWEPTLRQLVMLEQHYETDQIVLSVCANKARLFPRFGISQITDDMLMNEVNVSVNVGMGSSNPNERFQKLMTGTRAVMETIQMAPPNFNVQEFIKEAYSNMGYRDGARFWSDKQDPRLMKAMQMIQQMQGMLQGKQMELQANGQIEQLKLQSNEKIKSAEIQVDAQRIAGDLKIREAEIVVEQQRLELEKLKLQIEASGNQEESQLRVVEIQKSIEAAEIKLEQERQKLVQLAVKIAGEAEKTKLETEKLQIENRNAEAQRETGEKVGQVAEGVSQAMKDVAESISQIRSEMLERTGMLGTQTAMLGQNMAMMMQPKRKPTGFTLKKPDGKKTQAVLVAYDDGTEDELRVS